MPARTSKWVWTKTLDAGEKAAIATACDRFIGVVLKPRFLPAIQPTSFNYPIDIFGRWGGSKYSFIVRYRSGFADNAGERFDSAFTRFDHVDECLADTRFDVMWCRHTGQWWCLHSSAVFDEALHLVETKPQLWPPI
jgi:hypothetical protein